jgi:dienelactone hydrolase
MFWKKINFNLNAVACLLLVLMVFFPVPVEGAKKPPPTKTVYGKIVDLDGKPVQGAKVFITEVSKKRTTIVVSNDLGNYSIYGLNPKEDYEVHVEAGNLTSEKRTVSHFLTRMDNLLNFTLSPVSGPAGSGLGPSTSKSIEIPLPGGTLLPADFWRPATAPPNGWPVLLLLPDWGQDRAGWNELIPDLFTKRQWAVLNLDGKAYQAAFPNSRGKDDPGRLLPVVDALLEWLRGQEKIDPGRIAVAGYGFGADLAFLASGKNELVRASIAISPTLLKTEELVKSIPNFQPHSILYLAGTDDNDGVTAIRAMEAKSGYPMKVQLVENSTSRGLDLIKADAGIKQIISQWLENSQ